MWWPMQGPFPPVPCAEPTACTVRVPQRLLALIPGAAEMPLPNPEAPEQSHVADSMLHALITAILVATGAVIASSLATASSTPSASRPTTRSGGRSA